MPGKPFRVESRACARPGHRIVRLVGRVELDTVPEFLRALRAEQAAAVILDLSDVSYLDSSGVGALIQTYSSLRRADRRLALVAPTDRVQAVLEVTRVHKLFQIYPTVAEAEIRLARAEAHTTFQHPTRLLVRAPWWRGAAGA